MPPQVPTDGHWEHRVHPHRKNGLLERDPWPSSHREYRPNDEQMNQLALWDHPHHRLPEISREASRANVSIQPYGEKRPLKEERVGILPLPERQY